MPRRAGAGERTWRAVLVTYFIRFFVCALPTSRLTRWLRLTYTRSFGKSWRIHEASNRRARPCSRNHVLGHPVAAPEHGSTDRQAFERTVRRLLGPSQSLGAVCRSRPSQGLCATAAALAGGLRGGRRAPRARAAPHSRRCVALPRVRDGTQRCDAAENSLQHTAHHADARHG